MYQNLLGKVNNFTNFFFCNVFGIEFCLAPALVVFMSKTKWCRDREETFPQNS